MDFSILVDFLTLPRVGLLYDIAGAAILAHGALTGRNRAEEAVLFWKEDAIRRGIESGHREAKTGLALLTAGFVLQLSSGTPLESYTVIGIALTIALVIIVTVYLAATRNGKTLMRTSFFIVWIASLTFFSGCVQSINWNDPLAIANRVQVKQDDFKKVTSFIGPNCALDQTADTLVIRAWKLGDGNVEYQIYVADEYVYEVIRGGSGWRLYSLGHDSDGNSLEATVISRNVNWCGRNVCSYVEILGIGVTRGYLEERKDRGITFKISGKSGEQIFTIPAAYVQAFLSVAK
jgi:hypothetical protein